MKAIFLLLSLFVACAAQAQERKPKLVIGIVVDQMRYDLLYKYWDKLGNGGFKRLVKDGYSFSNTHYTYTPTYTGPGHASVYTGTTPAFHGIAANEWFDRTLQKLVYVTEDPDVNGVGISGKAGKMSPAHLLSTTVTDELKLFTAGQSKVIGIALKDRGSILPAGHAADAAYWFDPETGNWGTSTFYMEKLPDWVTEFNARKLPATYLSSPWNTLLEIELYTESTADDNAYEKPFSNESKPVFPHAVHTLFQKTAANPYEVLRKTPFGNTYTTDFAIQAIIQEKMGSDAITDFLCLSFSSTDYVGHQFGPNSIEMEDTYLRLDKDLERLFNSLDTEVGFDDIVLFLTADHGASPVPRLLQDMGMPGGYFDDGLCFSAVRNYLTTHYGTGNWLLDSNNLQLCLNTQLITEKNLDESRIQSEIAEMIEKMEGVYGCITASEIQSGTLNYFPFSTASLGYYPGRSGDVLILLKSGWMEKSYTFSGGTTHGSFQNYDTHVPNIWMGFGIPHGENAEKVSVCDIAPTLSNFLHISQPSDATGYVLEFE